MTQPRSLEIASRVKADAGLRAVDSWVVEKLFKVAEELGITRKGWESTDPYEFTRDTGSEYADILYEAYRNLCKLASWMGAIEYSETGADAAFNMGAEAMLDEVERLLAPILEGQSK